MVEGVVRVFSESAVVAVEKSVFLFAVVVEGLGSVVVVKGGVIAL